MANTQGIRAGKAFVEIGGDDSRLLRALKRAQARLKAFGAGVRQVGLHAIAASAAILAPLAGAARIFATTGDQLEEMAARTGVSVEALSELGFAAELSGASIETLENGIRIMQRTINDARRGLSTATDALADLGLNVQHLAALSPEEQFQAIADAISRVEDPSKRAALAMQVLGRSGTQLIPLLGSIRALRAQASSLGLTITSRDAASAARLADALDILGRSAPWGTARRTARPPPRASRPRSRVSGKKASTRNPDDSPTDQSGRVSHAPAPVVSSHRASSAPGRARSGSGRKGCHRRE